MSAQRQGGREAQAAAEALGSALVAFVLRYVPLELRAVARGEAALGAAKLGFETLRRGRPEARARVRLPLPRGAGRSYRHMTLKRSDVIKRDQPITTNNHHHLTKGFFASWLEALDICPTSGFLIPCISLTWFFNITLVANVVLVSVQYLKISTSRER